MDQEPEVAAVLEQRAELLGAEFLAIAPHPDAYPKPWSMSLISVFVLLVFVYISPGGVLRTQPCRQAPGLECVSGRAGVQGMAQATQGIEEEADNGRSGEV